MTICIDGAFTPLPCGQQLAIFIYPLEVTGARLGIEVFDRYFLIVQKSRLKKNIRVMKEMQGTKLELKV